jgi:glycine/D-amino acid oxidase-like deaminating enzyme
MGQPDIVIVGGGLAGLACARAVHAAGKRPLLLEAADRVGGRVRTEEVEGFRLDRGFQVFLEAYPEARRVLDYGALALRRFRPGARVFTGRGFATVSDPRRRPLSALATLLAPVGGLCDKLRVHTLRARARKGSLEDLFCRPARRTGKALHDLGFSDRMIGAFFRPFLSGIFLDPTLDTSSRMLEFVIRMFAEGSASIPARGMEEIPRQLAARLPGGSLRTGVRVTAAEARFATLETGERIEAGAVVLATESTAAAVLAPEVEDPGWRGVRCLYFDAPRPPRRGPWLLLDGTGEGPVTNLCFPSEVAPDLAPPGRTLVSASALRPASEDAVRGQLARWFGEEVRGWRHLRTFDIPCALPVQTPEVLDPVEKPARLSTGLFICGDHRDTGSIQGALASGRRAAEAALASLDGRNP